MLQTLDRMREEAEQTEERCVALADDLDGKKTAVLEKARETRGEATEMMSTYLDRMGAAIQERHFKEALEGSLQLAGQEDPDEPS